MTTQTIDTAVGTVDAGTTLLRCDPTTAGEAQSISFDFGAYDVGGRLSVTLVSIGYPVTLTVAGGTFVDGKTSVTLTPPGQLSVVFFWDEDGLSYTVSRFFTPRLGFLWADLVAELDARSHPSAPQLTTWDVAGLFYAREFLVTHDSGNPAFSTFHPGHDLLDGSPFWPHLHLVGNSDTAGVARFVIVWTISERDGKHTSGSVTLDCSIPAGAATPTRTHMVFEVGDEDTIPGPDIDGLIDVRVYRDGTAVEDTYPGSVWVRKCDMHYMVDPDSGGGTASKAAPFRTP